MPDGPYRSGAGHAAAGGRDAAGRACSPPELGGDAERGVCAPGRVHDWVQVQQEFAVPVGWPSDWKDVHDAAESCSSPT